MSLADLKTKAAANKKIAATVILVLFCGLIYAGYWGWQQYLHRQSALYAAELIKEALNPPDPARLARFVDFRRIGDELATAVARNFPFYKNGPDQRRDIAHVLQNVLLKRLSAKNDKPEVWPTDEEELLKKDLELLPPDFLTQLIATMTVRQEGENSAYLSAQINNPMLGQTFPLIFRMSRSADGWKLTQLANAGELADDLRRAMIARHNKYRELFAGRNAALQKTMNSVLPVQSCSADAGLLSDGKTLLMTVRVIARNRGEFQINNFNLDTRITGKNGALVTRRFLNAAKPVAPGEDFDHRWQFELESSSPDARRILSGSPLRCSATWQTLSLANGQVLHMVEEPFPDTTCGIDGHNHPAGFCMTPLFRD